MSSGKQVMRILKLVGQKLLSYLTTKFSSLMYREISGGKEESINNKIVGVKGSIRKRKGFSCKVTVD